MMNELLPFLQSWISIRPLEFYGLAWLPLVTTVIIGKWVTVEIVKVEFWTSGIKYQNARSTVVSASITTCLSRGSRGRYLTNLTNGKLPGYVCIGWQSIQVGNILPPPSIKLLWKAYIAEIMHNYFWASIYFLDPWTLTFAEQEGIWKGPSYWPRIGMYAGK